MKKIYELELKNKITNLQSNDEMVSFVDGDERIEITTEHYQDCCENVYGDFSNFKYHKEAIESKKFNKIEISGIENLGLLISFGNIFTKVLVPCYNSQNGYYSDNLTLLIKKGDTKTTIDVTGFKEDDIS